MIKLIQYSLVALGYFATGWFGLHIPYAGTHITLVWLPTGIAVAALLTFGRQMWPSIFLGALLVNLVIGSSFPLAAGIAVGNTLAPILTATLLQRWQFSPDFSNKPDVGRFVLATALGMLVSSTSGVIQLNMAGLSQIDAIGTDLMSWWLGDTVGVMLAAPVLLTLSAANIEHLLSKRGELLFWLAIVLPASWLIFLRGVDLDGQALPIAFLTLPLLAWAALSFGVTGSSLASLMFSVLAAWGTANRHGTFFLSDPHASLFLLWAYMGSSAVTGLLITALQAEKVKVERTLRSNQKQLSELFESRQAILDGTNFSIISTDAQGIIRNFNAGAERMLGYTAAEMVGKQSPLVLHDREEVIKRAAQLSKEIGKPVVPGFETFVIKARLSRKPDEHEWTYIRKDGKRFPVLVSVSALVNKHDELIGYLGVALDRTEYQHQENLLRDSEELFRVLYESSTEAHMLVTQEQGFIGANPAAVRLFGCASLEEFLKLTPASASPDLQSDGARSETKAQRMMQLALENGSHVFEWIHKRTDGIQFFAEVLLTQIHIGGKNILHAVVRDITLRKAFDEEISKLAFYDALTGLPNRRLLMDRLKQTVASSSRNRREGALMFIDLDHFKNLNDTLGHDMGDLLLREVAVRLTECVRTVDTVARLGGDEFVIMVTGLSEDLNDAASQVEKIGMKILSTLNLPYELKGNTYRNTPSIGVAMFSNCNDDVSELLKQADLAMYQAKATGRNNMQFFDSKVQEIVNAHVAMEAELRNALARNEFELFYQSQVDSTLRVIGAEVLIRWHHPRRGIIPPADFIALAETTSLIIPMGLWVLETACAQLARWATMPALADLSIAVNVSAIQFSSLNYVEQVISAIERTGVNPRMLKLEITESILLDDVETIIAKMHRLKAYGISFALDDFGTGYSSLAYLKRLPLNQLKIDQSFVRDVLADPNDATFARTIINLGQSLGLDVVAEGVENSEQLKFLADHRCDGFQGYLFGEPVTIEEFEQAMLKRVVPPAGTVVAFGQGL